MNWQSIINFFLSPLGFIIIFGAFSTGARMFKSAQEQQAKKRELQKLRDAQRDSLRTGARPTAASTPVSQTPAETKPSWDTQQEQRRERIEALRRQRQAQLERIREQRQSKASSAPSPTTTQPQSSAQGMAKRPPAQKPLRTTGRSKPTSTPQPPAQSPIQPKPASPQRAVAPVIAATQQAAQRRRQRNDPRATTPSSSPITMSTDTPITRSSITGSPRAIRSMIRTDLRSAILAKEILGTPLGLRSPGSDPISGD